MALNLPCLLAYCTLVAGWAFTLYKVSLRWIPPVWQLPYPPGPPERSIITGNAADISVPESWLTYAEFARKYGSVLHFRVYWKHIIVLNSYAAGIEFLEKRSNIYSDRPDLAIIDMMGWGFNATLMRYGSRWRSHRRMYQQVFKLETVSHYDTIQTTKVVDFLCGLLKTPEDFVNHYRTLPGAVIMSAVYGHDVAQKNDYFVELAEAAIERLG